MPSGPTDFFLPIADSRFHIMLILISWDVASNLHICAKCCVVDLTNKMYLERSIIVAVCVAALRATYLVHGRGAGTLSFALGSPIWLPHLPFIYSYLGLPLFLLLLV